MTWKKAFNKWLDNIAYNYIHSDEIRDAEDIRTEITDMINDLYYNASVYSYHMIWDTVDKYYQDYSFSGNKGNVKSDIVLVLESVVDELGLLHH